MSISTYVNDYVKSFDKSIDVEDLRNQNIKLFKENQQLKQQLLKLTVIIEQMTSLLEQKIGQHINQPEMEVLVRQVVQLQQQLQQQQYKNKVAPSDENLQETNRVIAELANQFQTIQQQYQSEISRLQQQLNFQKTQSQSILKSMDLKFSKTKQDYQNIVLELRKRDDKILNLQNHLTETMHASKKQLKISTTIEDLRITLQRQIQQKNRVIRIYQNLIHSIREKISQ